MKTKEEVLSILKTHPNGNIEEPQFKKKFPEHYQILSTWNFPSDFKFTQKLFHYFNDDPELKLGLCPVCEKRCKFASFGSGYLLHCSKDCATKDKNTLIKRKETCINRYGVENIFQSNEKKQKIKETLKEKYGVEHPLQSIEIRQKYKNTSKERYGVENYSSLSECRNKVKQTNVEKYGVEYYQQSEEYKKSVRKTSLKKYGVEHFTQTPEYKEKLKSVMIERYGVAHALQVKEFRQKAKETCIERYGVEYYTQTQECLDKMQATCQERYGVINYSQTKEWSHKKQKRYKYNNIYFDSLWEVEVFKYCEKNNIPCEYQPNITFEYSYKNTIHKYHPDFLINGKLYEVKGDQFFDGDKMICPYDRNNYKDELAEAKHQCMIKNNIIILKGDDIKNIKERIF